MIPILIPSRGRPNVKTLEQFTGEMIKSTTIFVNEADEDEYILNRPKGLDISSIVVTNDKEIADKRKTMAMWAKSEGHERFVMMDDDLVFFQHKGFDDYHLERCSPADMERMMNAIDLALDRYCHVSVSSREGNNRFGVGGPPLLIENVRPQRVLAYRTEEYLRMEHCRVRCMEDFDIALQLLRAGNDIATIAYWAQNQRQTQAPGGCSEWRTREVHDEAARTLKILHPDFVSLRQKVNIGGGSFGIRTEVTVQWKRARASAEG